jgi:hypothetical protein
MRGFGGRIRGCGGSRFLMEAEEETSEDSFKDEHVFVLRVVFGGPG